MSKPLDSVAIKLPRSMSWEDDDDEFMASVREDIKKFGKNTQPSSVWTKSEPIEKRPASTTGVSWSMPNLAVPRAAGSPASSGNSSSLRFDSLSPNNRTKANHPIASWRRN